MAYDVPTADDLIARYPAFAEVAEETVELWLTDAARVVDQTWPEASFAPAMMAHAAHMMAELGLPAGSSAIPAGVASFRSGAFSATISEALASATGYMATVYGRQFLDLRRAAFAGPRLAWDPPANVR